MGSSSNRHHISTDFIAAMSENSTFDLNQGLADTVFRRNGLSLHEYLEVPERSEPPSPTSATDLFQISANEDSVLENSVPMQLLNQAEQERADLLLISPKARIEGNCITAFHYIFIVKLFLYKLKGHGHLRPISACCGHCAALFQLLRYMTFTQTGTTSPNEQ